MKKRKLTVKVSSLDEALVDFKVAWEKAERGGKFTVPTEVIGFENAALLMKTLTPKRLELLQKLHAIGSSSIRALAKKLERDYSNVHQDVEILNKAGLLLKDKKGHYSMPWDKIVTEIPMTQSIDSPRAVSRKHSYPTNRKGYTLKDLLHGATPENLKALNKATEWAREGKSAGHEL